MKKFSKIFAPLVLVSMALVGCADQEQKEQKSEGVETLTLATWGAPINLTNAVEAYNQLQSDYMIEVKDYSELDNYESENPEDWNKGRSTLASEIAAGELPDIINTMGLDRTIYGKNGAFLDLYDTWMKIKKSTVMPLWATI